MELRRTRVADLERELEARAHDLVSVLDEEIRSLRERRDALNKEIGRLSRKRVRYAAQIGMEGRPPRDPTRPPKTVAAQAVADELAPRHLRLREIHAELVARGWSDDTSREKHALEVAVRSLETTGRIRRISRGLYASSRGDAGRVAA